MKHIIELSEAEEREFNRRKIFFIPKTLTKTEKVRGQEEIDADLKRLHERRGTVELSPDGEIIVNDIYCFPAIAGG